MDSGSRSVDTDKKPNNIPHYSLPNFTVVLPTYSNHEANVIHQAFSVGNFTSIADVPHTIKPGHVSRGRFQKILDNRQPPKDGTGPHPGDMQQNLFGAVRTTRDKTNRAKYFTEFEYIESEYSLASELARQEHKDHESKRAELHKQPFQFSDTRVKLKHEDAFESPEFRYLHAIDPFESANDQTLRQQWIQDAKVVAGGWRPGGKDKGPTGQAATEKTGKYFRLAILQQLEKVIKDDWEDFEFIVCSTDDDHIVVRFELETLQAEPGLVAYMNVLARTNSAVNDNNLTKVVEDWNVTPGDGYLYFTFRPPWVKSRPVDSFFALHPEEKVFQDPRSAKNDSTMSHENSQQSLVTADALMATLQAEMA